MNSSQFFDLLNETDSNYLAAAHKSMTEKPARAWFRPALIAACLTLVLLAIPVGIMIGKSNNTPQVPVIDPSTSDHTVTTVAPHTTEAPKTTARPSILDIPGATVFDENDNRFYKPGNSFSGSLSISDEKILEWTKHMKENNSIVIGYIKDYTTVLVEDGKDYYQISTMEIQVLENVNGIEEKTITAVYACRYYNEYGHYRPDGTYRGSDSIWSTCDQFREALICTDAYVAFQGKVAGWFLLKKANDQKLMLGDTFYNLSDYAEYVLDASLRLTEYGGLFLNLGAGYYSIPSSFVEEAFNKSFTNPYPCPYKYPFSYPLVETPKNGDSNANDSTSLTS